MKWNKEYLYFVFLALFLVGALMYVREPEVAAAFNLYFRRPITEMTIADFVFWLWLIKAIFSK